MPDLVDRPEGVPVPPTPAQAASGGGSPFAVARGMYEQLARIAPTIEKAIFGADAQVQQAGQIQQAATVAAGNAAAEEARQTTELAINSDEQVKQLLRAVGLDVNDPNSKLNQEIYTAAEARKQKNLLRTKITELQGKTLFSDPIGWIMAQPQLQQLIPQHNQQVDVETDAQEEIQRIENLATNVKQNTPTRAADILRAQAQAKATQFVENAKAMAADISAKNAAGHAKALMDAFTLRENLFQRALGLTQAEESMKMRQVQMAQLEIQRTLMNDVRKEKAEQAAEIRRQQELFVVGINAARKMINGDPRDVTLEEIKRWSPQQRELWSGVLARGNFGNNYAESVSNILEMGNAANAANAGNGGMIDTAAGLDLRIKKRARELMDKAAANPMGAKLGAKEAMSLAATELYEQDKGFARKGADKTDLPISSPYSLNYDAILAATKGAPQSFISKMLAEEAAKSRTHSLDTYTERQFLNAAKLRVLAGEVDPKKAAEEIARFYAQNTANNYTTNALNYFALPIPVDWQINIDGKVGGKKVDLMNPTQLENYLTSEIASKKRSERVGLNNPFIPFR